MFSARSFLCILVVHTHAVDDPCDAAPCANGGTCSRTGLTDVSCACDGNWEGSTCNSESIILIAWSALLFMHAWFYLQ